MSDTSDNVEESKPAPDLPRSSFDFDAAISKLDKRSKSSRRMVAIYAIFIMMFLVSVSVYLISQLTYSENISKIEETLAQKANIRSNVEREASMGTEELINVYTNYIQGVLEKKIENNSIANPNGELNGFFNSEISEAINNIRSVKEFVDIPVFEATEKDYSSLISTSILSFGVVGFVVLAVQICVSFMRYHTQLAELYEAQADALRAANGDATLAYEFMDKFSPTRVHMGKTPATLYEKAFDTIKELGAKIPGAK